MKILHVKDIFDPDGNYQINELLRESSNYDDEVSILSTYDLSYFHKKYSHQKDKEFSEKYNVKIFRKKHTFKISSRFYTKGLFKEIDKINPDIVFIHNMGDIKDFIIAWSPSKKYILVRDCHMSWSGSKNKFNRLFYLVFQFLASPFINNLRRIDIIYSLGLEEKEYLKALGIKENIIKMLPHGYNNKDFYYDEIGRGKIRKELNINDEDILISSIGKFNFEKRPDLLIDILEKLGEKFISEHNIKVVFVGSKDSNYMESCFSEKLEQSFIKKYSFILPVVHFSLLKNFFSASDICFWPKQTTLSSIHAQVCQTSVVMEKETSNMERVIDHKNLYEKNNNDEAANIIKKLILTKKYKKENNTYYLDSLKNREYGFQYSELRKTWLKILNT